MNLRLANRLLTATIVAINAYIIFLPIYPVLSFWWQAHISDRQQAISSLVTASTKDPGGQTIPDGEWLVIPKLLMKERIFEGYSVFTVNKGVWHYPKAGAPNAGGNTVLIGHRFTYEGPSVFYHLDLMKKGDPVYLFWDRQKFSYTVTDIKVVSPNDTGIQQNTADDRLTIYTCTPLWSTKQRLVVIAKEVLP